MCIRDRRGTIEKASRSVYDLVTASDRVVPNETLEQRNKRLDQADSDYPASAAGLSQMLLAPLGSELKNKRLLIVGEGILQYVPFGALPEPGIGGQVSGAGDRKPDTRHPIPDAQPLIASHEVITLPSASVLGVLRSEAK